MKREVKKVGVRFRQKGNHIVERAYVKNHPVSMGFLGHYHNYNCTLTYEMILKMIMNVHLSTRV